MTPAIPTNRQSPTRIDDATYVIGSLNELEQAIGSSPLSQWETLLDADPSGTLFQSPVWCLPWYRSYTSFEPRVLVVVRGGELIGVVPLAVEIATRRLTFGGDNMTDYRDVVTRPEYRAEVVGELLRYYKQGEFPNMLPFGSTLPESETPGVLVSTAPKFGVRTVVRSNYGWRWWPHQQAEDVLKSRSLRYKMNSAKRQGPLEVEYVRSEEEWERFKEDFYRQHTLRQISADRPVSFDNPQKREFFDRLFRAPCGHVIALRLNGKLLAGHVGATYRDVLYWGAPSFDIVHRQYSPNLLLLVLTMKKSGVWGFTGIDLTIGEGDLKERYSTSRVDLPWIELYARPSQFFARKLRVAAAKTGRNVIERVGGAGTWKKRIKPGAATAAAKLTRARERGWVGSLRMGARVVGRLIGEHTRGIVFIARPEDVREVQPQLSAGENCVFHDNELNDLLKRDRWGDAVSREIAVKVKDFTDLVRAGKTFHTVLVNDRLAAWGYSYSPSEPATLTEVGGAILEFEPQSVSLYDFYTLPEFRGRKLYQALLSHILSTHFSSGARQAYITVLEKNAPSRVAIERVGFKRVTINEVTRFLKWKKLRSTRV
jgi:CelD/BcsL family acetyltransferase involved in cellulose biosynthesis/GNAT superfamily N-acetyltransferase